MYQRTSDHATTEINNKKNHNNRDMRRGGRIGDVDRGSLPPGWTLTGLPEAMTHAFRQRAVHRIATRFIPMLRHRRNLRNKRAATQPRIRVANKDLAAALLGTGSALFAGPDAAQIVDACIAEGVMSLHGPGEIVCYAGEPCAPSAWFLLRGRLDSFAGSVSWHSPNLSTGVQPSFESMTRLSYVYRHQGGAAAVVAGGGGGALVGGAHSDGANAATASQPTFAAAAATFVVSSGAERGAAGGILLGGAAGAGGASSASAAAAVPGETLYTCTHKGGMSRHVHGRRGGVEVRAPRALADLASLASYRFTSFLTVPFDAPEDALVLRVPRATLHRIYTRVLSHDQRDELRRKQVAHRERDMSLVHPLHALQVNESWLFRGIGVESLRALARHAAPCALVAGQLVAQRGRRLAHMLFVQRGLIALVDERSSCSGPAPCTVSARRCSASGSRSASWPSRTPSRYIPTAPPIRGRSSTSAMRDSWSRPLTGRCG